jgi:parvulin-like peptidyl-prolyl isomerase
MFEKFAARFQTYVLIALVTLLSAVFILQFGGPQAEGCTTGGSSYAAQVDGEVVSAGEFRSVYYLLGFNRAPAEQQRSEKLWSVVLDGLIERSLLANAAREIGYHVTEDEVMHRLATEGTIRVSLGASSTYGGAREIQVDGAIQNRDGVFDVERAKSFIQNTLRRSVGEFTVAQIEEELAERMRQTVLATVEVSEREVWDAYIREADRARIEYVRFAPAYYRETIEPTDAELDAWIEAHPEEVNQEYEQNRHRYTDLDEQVRARHILIKAGSDASEDEKAEARGRAESLLRQVRAGADFAELARVNSEDTGSARRGGDLGFNPRGRMVGAFDEAQFGLEVGGVSDLVETQFGFHIIRVEAKREGDVPEAEAKRELADRLYRDDRAETLARDAATGALAAWKSGLSRDELDAWLLRRERGEPEPEPVDPDAEVAADADADADTDEEEEEVEERNPLAPRVAESSSFGQTDNPIRGPFDSGPLVRDVFSRNLEDPAPEEPIQLGNDFVIYTLTERTEANQEGFTDEVRQRLRMGLLRAKRSEALASYVRDLRTEAERAGKIRVQTFELEAHADGNGEVRSIPEGISCGSDCTASYDFGTMVQLTARVGDGARFLGWSGACTGSDETCVVTLDEARDVTARFRGGSAAPESDEGSSDDEASDEPEEAPEPEEAEG